MKFAFVLVAALSSTTAFAQDSPELRDNRVTINVGATWLGGYDVGTSTARLRGNGAGLAPPSFTLFTADSHFSTATAPELRVGFSFTSRLTLEGGATLAHPRVGISIANDAEAPDQDLPGEQLEQYVFDAGMNWQLPIAMGPRAAPFVTGGAGYLRQLHQDRTYAETGRIYYAGAGARLWLRGGHGRTAPAGLRGELRMNLRNRGIDFEDKMRTYPSVSIFLFIGI